MTKRIRLTIEWDGSAPEHGYADMVVKEVEEGDRSKLTRVVKVECLTDYGYTPPVPTPGIPHLRPLFGPLSISRFLRGDW